MKSRLNRDSRREAILDVAAEVFLEEGYDAASMSTIATRVGGSKSTLYNYFKSKDEIFVAHIERYCGWQREAMFQLLDEDADLRDALTHVGRRYLANVLSDRNMSHFRLIVAAAERSPDLGRAFYEAGPSRGASWGLATIPFCRSMRTSAVAFGLNIGMTGPFGNRRWRRMTCARQHDMRG